MTPEEFQPSEMSFLYITVPDMEIARVIAGGAIREKLAARAAQIILEEARMR